MTKNIAPANMYLELNDFVIEFLKCRPLLSINMKENRQTKARSPLRYKQKFHVINTTQFHVSQSKRRGDDKDDTET